MEEVTKTIYRAKDGKEFITREECEKHEKFLSDTEEIKKAYDAITKYCANNCNEDKAYNEQFVQTPNVLFIKKMYTNIIVFSIVIPIRICPMYQI